MSTIFPAEGEPEAPGGLRIKLRWSSDELRQRDAEKLMAAMTRSPLGESMAEHSGKVLRAAVECGWVEEPVFTINKEVDMVAELKPWQVRWYAQQIDYVYAQAVTIPKV